MSFQFRAHGDQRRIKILYLKTSQTIRFGAESLIGVQLLCRCKICFSLFRLAGLHISDSMLASL